MALRRCARAPPPGAPRPGVEGRVHDPVGAQEIARTARLAGIDRLRAADLRGVELLARHPLDEDGEERCLLHAPAGSEQAVVGEQHRVLVGEAAGDDLAFAIGGRQPGPVAQERDVVVERRRVHVGDDERLLGRGERRRRRRMRVDDRGTSGRAR